MPRRIAFNSGACLGFGKPPPPLESRAKGAARLNLEVSAGWARPSSRGLLGWLYSSPLTAKPQPRILSTPPTWPCSQAHIPREQRPRGSQRGLLLVRQSCVRSRGTRLVRIHLLCHRGVAPRTVSMACTAAGERELHKRWVDGGCGGGETRAVNRCMGRARHLHHQCCHHHHHARCAHRGRER